MIRRMPDARDWLSAIGLLTAAIAFAPRNAEAADCSTVNKNPVVWVTGTAKNYLAALARVLYTDTQPITILWVGNSSCDALDATLNGTPLTGTASYWDPSVTPSDEVQCTIGPLDGGLIHADISITDVFPTTCVPLPNGLPNDVGDFLGPVQTMAFVVPKASLQSSISATAAFYVYGFGSDSGVAPWTDASNIYRLDDASGTQRILAAAINVPYSKWKGVNIDYSALMISAMQTAPAEVADSTIGILAATNITDAIALQLKVLAYKHYGQSCAYYPDSSESSNDKRNVRDGHYAPWAPIHLFTKIDTKGYPLNDNASRVINYLTGSTPPPGGLDLIEVASVNNLVPTCAMKVKRASEMGTMAPFAPQNPCNCTFEKIATGSTSCQSCTAPTDCPSTAPVCSFSYCESP
jgi:hypothetical protein